MIGLDDKQQGVVGCMESQVVIAGPGSGKTRVLTEKARQLFGEGKDILCITFTRSAAGEMQSRVPGLPACTIHSYCCGNVGWDEDWGYDGLLYRFTQMDHKKKFEWVLLDEAQDLNQMELDVVISLIGDKLFAVGDPYQSIYGFQGAMGSSVIKILNKMGCKISNLNNNYRSKPEIVSRLNKWFNRNLVSVGIKDTGLTAILFRRNDDLFYVSGQLKAKGIPHKIRLSIDRANGKDRENDVLGSSNLRLMTIHCSKGQEFDKVLLFSWYPDSYEEERRVYYVAMARASKSFVRVENVKELIRNL